MPILRLFFVAVLLLLPISASPLQAQEAQESKPPNLVLILADDLGYGELGCYGQTRIRTPRLDAMAAEGMRFTSFYAAAPVCAPTRCSIITGRHGGHAFIRDNIEVKPEGQLPLPAGTTTLPWVLQQAGYATGMFGKWGLGGPGSSGEPNAQGFDSFFGYLCQRQAHNFFPTHLWRDRSKVPLEGNVPGNVVGAQYSHDLIVTEALAFLGRAREQPFFLYLPVTIPHVALQVPDDSLAEYRGRFAEDPPYQGNEGYLPHPTPRAAYAAMVTRLDRDVGRLLDRLRELGLASNTLVVFTSDNGPTHGRVGGADSTYFESTGGLRGRKGSVYEGGLRVPAIAWWPGRIAPGRSSDAPFASYDLFPTFARLAKAPLPDGLDGVDFSAHLAGAEAPARDALHFEFHGYGGQQAVRFGRYKALRRDLKKGFGPLELYDLTTDPKETKNLAPTLPEIAARAESLLRDQHRPSREFPLPALDR